MFDLKISDLIDARTLVPQWATHTISLLDPNINREPIRLPQPGIDGQIRRYYFHDITPNSALAQMMNEYLEDMKVATSIDMLDILEFTRSLKSTDKLLVHCHAGISRSTAVACGVLCQHGLTPTESVKYVLSIRPQAFPNKHILTLFDELLGLSSQLVTAGTKELVELARSQKSDF